MRFLGLILASQLIFLASLFSQSATEPNEGKRISYDDVLDVYTISWWGKAGYTYFLQQSDDLVNWDWCPVTQQPQSDGVTTEQFSTNADVSFFRLVFSNDPDAYIFTDDFDGDRISNGDELAASMDPFEAEVIVDSDSDTLPDYWENFYFGDLDEGNVDSDGDGLLNADEYAISTDPSHYDTDLDGISDGIEDAKGTDPKSPYPNDETSVPAVETELLIFSPTR